jgi:serine/threonine-protein kinase
MGAVYEARHTGTGRKVALKVIVPEALASGVDVLARFHREALAAGSIDSPHVVQVLDSGVDPARGCLYMVMEMLSGEDVSELCSRLGALPPDLVLRIVAQACAGLQRAHETGVIHRDVKSANVYLARREGGERVVKLLDFGLAKVKRDQLAPGAQHGLTRTGTILGSPLYMSPEQARGSKSVDARSDVFSLGVLMYEALTGTVPNALCTSIADLILAVTARRSGPVQDRAPWVPPDVAAIVHKALALHPHERHQSAGEMHAAITALLPGGSAIKDEMLAGVPPEMRSYVAPRHEPPPQAPAPAPSSASFAETVPDSMRHVGVSPPAPGDGRSTAGVAAGASAVEWKPPPSPARWLVPLGVVGLLGAVVVGVIALAPWRRAPAAVPSITSVGVAPPASPTMPSSVAPATPPAPATSTVHVAVTAPAGATVEVDGRPAEIKEGKVEVSGRLGSVHPVRVIVGASETMAMVVLSESGPIPAKVEVVAPKKKR